MTCILVSGGMSNGLRTQGVLVTNCKRRKTSWGSPGTPLCLESLHQSEEEKAGHGHTASWSEEEKANHGHTTSWSYSQRRKLVTGTPLAGLNISLSLGTTEPQR